MSNAFCQLTFKNYLLDCVVCYQLNIPLRQINMKSKNKKSVHQQFNVKLICGIILTYISYGLCDAELDGARENVLPCLWNHIFPCKDWTSSECITI